MYKANKISINFYDADDGKNAAAAVVFDPPLPENISNEELLEAAKAQPSMRSAMFVISALYDARVDEAAESVNPTPFKGLRALQ